MRVIFLIAVFTLASGAFAQSNEEIDAELARPKVLELAEYYLGGQGHNIPGYWQAALEFELYSRVWTVTFKPNKSCVTPTKAYYERETARRAAEMAEVAEDETFVFLDRTCVSSFRGSAMVEVRDSDGEIVSFKWNPPTR